MKKVTGTGGNKIELWMPYNIEYNKIAESRAK